MRPLIGWRQRGAISASGASTKRRVSMRGCGRMGSGRARRDPPRSKMSRSISRGPFGKEGVRPTASSMRWSSRSRAAGERSQATAATAFQNGGCAA